MTTNQSGLTAPLESRRGSAGGAGNKIFISRIKISQETITMTAHGKILCVDDDADACELIKFVFEKSGLAIETASTPEEAMRRARTDSYDAFILDYRLTEIDGIDLCRMIRTFDSHTPIVFYSADGRAGKKQEAAEAGAQAFLVKPNDFDRLIETIRQLLGEPADSPAEAKRI